MSKKAIEASKQHRNWLLLPVLLLVAVVVFGGNYLATRDASADVVSADFCIDENVPIDDTTVECLDDPAPASIPVGEFFNPFLQYKVSILPLSQATLGDLVIVVTLQNADAGFINFGGGLPVPACVVGDESGANTTITCTYDGPIAAGSSGTITIDVAATGGTVNSSCTANDESAQPAQGCTDQTVDVAAFNFEDQFVKLQNGTDDPIVISPSGGTITYSLGYTHPAGAADIAIGDLDITDTFTLVPGATIDSISSNNADVTCTPVSPPSFPAGTTVICSNIALISAGENVTITVVTTIPANPDPSASRDVCNTGSVDATFGGSTFSDDDTVCATQGPSVGAFTKFADDDEMTLAGGETFFTITFTSPFGVTTEDVVITDVFDNGQFEVLDAFVSLGSDVSGTCDIDEGTSETTVTCTADAAVGPLDSFEVIIEVDVLPVAVEDAPEGIDVCNVAVVTGDAVGDGEFELEAEDCVFLAGAVIRHVDVDQAAENEGGNPLGILPDTDDVDQAIGALHTVCVFGGLFTSDDIDNIDWTITATELSPTTSNLIELSGDDLPIPVGDVPCVQWRSASVGDQSIFATFDDGEGDPVNIYFDGLSDEGGSQPLIKEWNSIDFTIIVGVSGLVGGGSAGFYDEDDGIADNTLETGNFENIASSSTNCERKRENTAPPSFATWCGSRANLDGTSVSVGGTLTSDGFVSIAAGRSFIDYTFGSHTTHYNGPIDGAEQTYTVGGCGSILLEDPVTGNVIQVDAGDSATVLTSNYGVAFTVLATTSDGNLDCRPGDETTILIETGQDVVLTSAEDVAPDEFLTVNFFAAQISKQPLLAWAGQRIVLPHNWSDGLGGCLGGEFDWALYEIEDGGGAFVPDAHLGEENDTDSFWASLGGVDLDDVDDDGDDDDALFDECISAAIIEKEDQGQVNVKATLEVDGNLTGIVYNFLIYYMEFEDITLGVVPGERAYHNNGPFDATGNPWDTATDTATATANVSQDVLLRARVRGWFKTSGLDTEGTNRPALDGKPSGRFVMPDDWLLLAGGDTALLFRPNYDIMLTPGGSLGCGSEAGCSSSTAAGIPATSAATTCASSPVVGPFSLLDPGPCTNSSEFGLNGGRETWLSDGQINLWDAPMPPALFTFAMVGDTATSTATSSGFLKSAEKFEDVYGGTNPYYLQAIPESPLLGSQNYLWDTWGGDGYYEFWDSVLNNRFPNSAAGSVHANNTELGQIAAEYQAVDPGVDVARILNVYSDNHGEAMVFINGDFRLTFAECATNIIGGGRECAQGDDVGTSSVFAVADYPDFKKKPQIASTPVTITWEWGGYKEVTIEPGETDQFAYVVFHALDRDGFCNIPLVQAFAFDVVGAEFILGLEIGGDVDDLALKPVYATSTATPTFTNTGTPFLVRQSVSLHPVLSSIDAENTIGTNDPVESVDFIVDAGEGIVLETSGGAGFIDPTRRFVTGVPTFSTADNPATGIREFPTLHGSADECQAWIRVSNSLLTLLNVIVTAHDDEGDVGFDVIVDFAGTFSYTLNFRWSLITWVGPDNIPVTDALRGTGANDAGNDIFDQVTAVYGWDQAAQQWLGFFPSGVDVPGANDLTVLENGQAYWIAIVGPGTVTWTVATNVGG